MATIGAQYYKLPGALGDTKTSTKLNFWHLWDHLIKLNQKMLREQCKIEMLQNVAPYTSPLTSLNVIKPLTPSPCLRTKWMVPVAVDNVAPHIKCAETHF